MNRGDSSQGRRSGQETGPRDGWAVGMITQPLKWHGGKSYLAKWIVSHYPPRNAYTHSLKGCAGGLATLFIDDPDGKSETVNDLNGQLANFWQVIRSPGWFKEFAQKVALYEFSDEQFEIAKNCCVDERIQNRLTPVDKATAFFVRYRMSRQGLGKDFATPTRRTRRGMNENVSSYLSAVDGMQDVHERLRRVEIRNMDVVDFIKKYDHAKAFFYLDPPYLHETRVTTSDYEHEMSRDDHKRLLSTLEGIKGMFLLSGYHSRLYDDWASWNEFSCAERQIDNKASSKRTKEKKTECLWMNYAPQSQRGH